MSGGGAAAEPRLGATHPLGPRLSAFAPHEANAVALDVDLVGGGAIEARLVTHAINLGLPYRFGGRQAGVRPGPPHWRPARRPPNLAPDPPQEGPS